MGLQYPNSPFVTNDGVRIANRIPTISMTLDIGGKSDYTFQNKLGLLAHEYGHYLFGAGHNFELAACSGTAQRGLGLMPAWAGSLAMNPHEKYLLGYTTYTDIFYDQTGALSDYQNSHVSYRIPIPVFNNGVPNYNPTEFYIIANHQKNSVYELTKATGIYVYHVKNINYGQNHMDMVAADGLWQWSVLNWVTPVGSGGPADWFCKNGNVSPQPTKLPIPIRISVDRVNGRDELQEVVQAQYPVSGPYYGITYWWDKWYNESGGTVESPIGDMQDAFNIGYNQLFSKYSNPPAYDKNRAALDVALELISNNNGQFNLQFRMDATSVLNAPPSKPQNLKVTAVNGFAQLTWEQNIEPDMQYSGKYKIYWASTSGGEPTSFSYKTTINAYNGTTPITSWTDPDPWVGQGSLKLFYRITAVDNGNLESVPSDYNYVPWSGYYQKQSHTDDIVISDYKLYDNYPNPFNPMTTLQFDVKEKGFVSLNVYDLLGKEIASLVNESKDEGRYSVNFDARNLPSGVYIYTIRVNDFVTSKKMTLLK